MRDDYRRVLVVASAAALTDALLKSPHAHVVMAEAPPAPKFEEICEPLKFAPTARVDRDKPWRRWPVRR